MSDLDETPEAAFWTWFSAHADALRGETNDGSPLIDEMHERLRRCHGSLVFELFRAGRETREFVISADGILDCIPTVLALMEVKPAIPGWKVIAFRPRMPGCVISWEDQDFDSSKTWVRAVTNDGFYDLTLYLPGYEEGRRNEFLGPAYILLDTTLGEFDVMTKIRNLSFSHPLPHPEAEGLIILKDIHQSFDAFFTELPDIAFEESQFALVNGSKNGVPLIWRLRMNTPPPGQRLHLPWRVEMTWSYKPVANAMPSSEDRDRMTQLELALEAGVEDAAHCVMASSEVGDGKRVLAYYIRNEDQFLEALNTTLADLPRFPLVINVSFDPQWLTHGRLLALIQRLDTTS